MIFNDRDFPLLTVAGFVLFLFFPLFCNATHGTASDSVPSPWLSLADKQHIGERIWRNEGGGDWEKLIWWNQGEGFVSLGIGHFIWYREGHRERYMESFPALIRFLKKNEVRLPKWLDVLPIPGCPWPDREAWLRAKGSPRYQALYDLLRNTVDWQLYFIVERFRKALPRVIAAVNPTQRAVAKQAILELQQSAQGLYALVDYVNFKGEGLSSLERYAGQGWGLVQVLETMRPGTLVSAPSRFANAAKKTLLLRVANAPKERAEGRWLTGWLRRVDTYRQPFTYRPYEGSENQF